MYKVNLCTKSIYIPKTGKINNKKNQNKNSFLDASSSYCDARSREGAMNVYKQ